MRFVNTLLQKPGFLFALGAENPLQRKLITYRDHAYQAFRRSWGCLARDPYLRDGGHYRYRRYSVFHWQHEQLRLLPHEPHYQSKHYNPMHGGFNRYFRPWLLSTVVNPAFKTIVQWATAQFCQDPQQLWRIQGHQFRVVANVHESGKPTPEGVHKDGADYILIMLMDRHNVCGGVSQIFDNAMQPLAEGTLQQAGDLVLVNDHAVYHGVSEIYPENPAQPAWRDVLVLTFHKQG